MHFQGRQHRDILELFAAEKRKSINGFVRVSAPMVRYSKLEFRKLLRQQGVQLCFTPMIIADSFNNSQKARLNEFTTDNADQPVIAQFAAKDTIELVRAAQLIYPYVDGIDLNCGCPQSWAITKGYGCGLLRQPEKLCDIVQSVRRTLPEHFSISVKLRLLHGHTVRTTVELARQLEHCGVTFITLHGRTPSQRRSTDVLNVPAMCEVKQSVQLPLIVNGSVRSWQDACKLYEQTQADGIMSARGLLANPALFNPEYAEAVKTPMECVQQWLDIAMAAGEQLNFQCFHHHLTFMWSGHMKRDLRLRFNNLRSKAEVFDFLNEHYALRPSDNAKARKSSYTKCKYEHLVEEVQETFEEDNTWNENADGKYFQKFKTVTTNNEIELAGSFFTDLF